MNKLSKIMWVTLYLVGLSSCMSRSGQRRAMVEPESTKESIAYYVKYKHSIYPLHITSEEYQVMKTIGMDSVTVEKYHNNDYFKLSDWVHGDYEVGSFLYVTIPFANIAGQNITPTK